MSCSLQQHSCSKARGSRKDSREWGGTTIENAPLNIVWSLEEKPRPKAVGFAWIKMLVVI